MVFGKILNDDQRKALAWEKCRSLDALVRYRRDIPRKIESSTASIPENKDHIRKMAKTHVVPGLLGENAIRKEYEYDLSYPTEVPSCRAWYEKENDYWSDHKLLNRAEQFADEALAESLKNAKQQATADLLKRLRAAEAEERVRKARHQEEYDAFLASRDKTVSGLHREKVGIREKIYESCLHDVKESLDVERLEKARSNFRKFGDYKDSAAMAEYCAGRIEEIKAAWKKAEQEVREQEERIDEHNHKLHKTLRWIEAILFLVGIAVMGCAGTYLSERLELMGSAATLQAILGLIPIGCTRLSIKLYEEDTTWVRFIRRVARVTTLLGIVGYCILAISMSDAEGSDFYLSIWGAIMCLKNLIAFIFPFYVKKLET